MNIPATPVTAYAIQPLQWFETLKHQRRATLCTGLD